MRALIIRAVLASLLSIAFSEGRADERVWSYTMEEIYDRASSYKQLQRRQRSSDDSSFVTTLVKAGEFRGYIAATMDSQNANANLNDCAKRLRLTEITKRVAVVLTTEPLDRSRNVQGSVMFAILFGCDRANDDLLAE